MKLSFDNQLLVPLSSSSDIDEVPNQDVSTNTQMMHIVWDQLAKEWEGHRHGVIAKVDCGDEETAATICQQFDIESIPYVIWGGYGAWDAYHGLDDHKSLSKFAKAKISKPICTLFSKQFCTSEEKATIVRLLGMPQSEFDALYKQAKDHLLQLTNDMVVQGDELMGDRAAILDKMNEQIDKIVQEHNFVFVDQMLRKRDLGVGFRRTDNQESG